MTEERNTNYYTNDEPIMQLFQFSVDDFEADMKLHSLVLKELNVRMYSSELYDDYMSVVDATDKNPVEEQNVNYYNNEKLWNRGR